MNENAKKIWLILRAAGMSEVGTAAMLGNIQAESAFRPNNAQDGMTSLSDEEYTAFVDLGTYANFHSDGVGYGYIQLTFPSRKKEYLQFAKARGRSIGDGETQVLFIIKELQRDNASLWAYLCGEPELYTAVSRICKEYERPATNNIDGPEGRFAFAEYWLKTLCGTTIDTVEQIYPTFFPKPIRLLSKGLKGNDVRRWQQSLQAAGFDIGRGGADGDFGTDTHNATVAFQKSVRLLADGIVGADTFEAMWRR